MPDLTHDEIDDALSALPGWHRDGSRVARQVPVPRDSREGLEEGVRNVIEDASRVEMIESDAGLTIVLGGNEGGTQPADIEAAARIDTVLSGSGHDHGTTN